MGIVYKWVDQSNNIYYIGSHKGTADDGYIGSGVHFSRAYSKRPKSFTRQILYVGEHYLELEEFILEELDAANDDMSYNLKNSSVGGNTGITEVGREKLSKARKGYKRSESDKQKQSASRKGRYVGSENSNSIKVYCGYTQKTYNTLKEVSNALGVSQPYCSLMIRGKRPNKFSLKQI